MMIGEHELQVCPVSTSGPYEGYSQVICWTRLVLPSRIHLGFVSKFKGQWRAITPKDVVVAVRRKTRKEAVEALYYQYFGHRGRK